SDKESESETLKKRIEEHRAAASGKRALHESLNRELADARVELGAITQTIKAKTESVDRLSKELETSKKDASELEAEIEDHQKEIEANKSNIEKRVEESAALEEKNRAMLEKARELEEKKSECRLEIQEVEDKQRRMMEQEASLGNDVARLELRIEQAVSDSERLYAEIWEEYKITPQTVSTVEDLGQSSGWLQKEERKLKSEMEQMGDVNVGAINEYKNLKLRLDFLKEQRDDILAAEAKLQDVIQELGELMQKRFLEQFEVISKNFTQVFQDMFGGGKGKLTLTEADSILEAGIEITAQPPGKNLQSMSLLSGGERALTAIALLFAILRMKPSPFCVLDEIEAALDDANVTRYARYIRKICNETQFILITHRKGTMEEADILYGVTMQEMGISKLVSAKLSEWVPSEPAYA
ncbi:MAG: chromosome segregation protein SMC, partial [Clostridiales bacterium]|nr:chromosome segregation protein SMC [Clostridiales bacterium]